MMHDNAEAKAAPELLEFRVDEVAFDQHLIVFAQRRESGRPLLVETRKEADGVFLVYLRG